MKRLSGMALTLALAGCGSGGEDFAVEIAGTPAETASALAGITFAAEKAELPGLKVSTARSGDDIVTYTIPVIDRPGHSAGEATVALRLESVAGKPATLVHAALDVPPTRVMMGKSNQVISEAKVATQLRRALSESDKKGAVRSLLTSVAIGSNAELQAKINGATHMGEKGHWREESADSDWGSAPGNPAEGYSEESDWGEG
jgi:hypothetical protein